MADQEAKNQRATCKRNFTRAEKALRNAVTTASTPKETMQRRFTDYKNTYEETQKAHNTYLNTIDPQIIDEEAEEVWMNEFADCYE